MAGRLLLDGQLSGRKSPQVPGTDERLCSIYRWTTGKCSLDLFPGAQSVCQPVGRIHGQQLSGAGTLYSSPGSAGAGSEGTPGAISDCRCQPHEPSHSGEVWFRKNRVLLSV